MADTYAINTTKPSGAIRDAPMPHRVIAKFTFGPNPKVFETEGWAIAWTRELVLVTWHDNGRPAAVWLPLADTRKL